MDAGVPEGSVLGPSLSLVCINDLTDHISSQMHLFADNYTLFTWIHGIEQTRQN